MRIEQRLMESKSRTAEDFHSLATEKYKNGDYQEAIKAFRKSITLEEHWNSYQGLGWALFITNQLQEAINAFQKSIALKETWDSYRGLGSTLFRTLQFKEAIYTFRKSLALKEHWNSYFGLGSALLRTNQFQEAIKAFQKSITLKETWDSYHGLGWSLLKSNQFSEAVNAFRKSIALKETWDSLLGLGKALCKTNQYSEAAYILNRSLRLVESSSIKNINYLYELLADAYKNTGNVDAAISAWESYFSYTEFISYIDPFLGEEDFYLKLSNDYLEELRRTCNSNKCDLFPSFQGNNDPSVESWKYLMYLHIRKSGGYSFAGPFYLLKEHLVKVHRTSPRLKGAYRYFNPGRYHQNELEVAALKNLISSNSYNKMKSIFFSTHGASWCSLCESISQTFSANTRIITTVRNPHQRLYSQIKHDAIKSNSSKKIYDIISEKNSEYDNVMHKYIFDYGLNGSVSMDFDLEKEEISKFVDKIDFIDINDFSTISKIKSAFLSASSLPNIVQYSRINNSKDREKQFSCKLSKHEIDYAFKHCSDKGFISKDESIDYDLLKRKTLDRLNFPSCFNHKICQIHPLTFLVSKEFEGSIIPTKDFLKDPIYYLQRLN